MGQVQPVGVVLGIVVMGLAGGLVVIAVADARKAEGKSHDGLRKFGGWWFWIALATVTVWALFIKK
ncbi:MAG: hypothetical protein HYU58_09000 [Proteobacteria bacterium]|nr:hypothetical protein [Pseudomonadota bacterium]